MYVRGNPRDFDLWEAHGNPGWSYDQLLPYFKKSENFHKTNPEAPVSYGFHGSGGYLSVEYSMPPNAVMYAFLNGSEELGYNLTDYNSPQQVGVSQVQYNTHKGRRADTGYAFIKPIENRSNLKIMKQSFVTKIDFDFRKKRATRIFFTNKETRYVAYANREIILSAGAIGSPQLLMLSGIGPENHLKTLNISVVKNLPVGDSLINHNLYLGLLFSTNVSSPEIYLGEFVQTYLNGTGELAQTGPSALGFFSITLESDPLYPDLELILYLQSTNRSKYFNRMMNWDTSAINSIQGTSNVSKEFSNFLMFVVNLHQKSLGTVRLNSSSPYDYPLVNSNYLSDEKSHDADVLYEGIKMSLKLIQTESFKKINTKLLMSPLSSCSNFEPWSKEYWYCTLKYLTTDIFHPMGTCPMGLRSKNKTVVNHRLQVHGIRNLRVADASVFPSTISGHPSAVCIMIGEKISDIIKDKYKQLN